MNSQALFNEYMSLKDDEAKKAFLASQSKRIQLLSSEERMVELKAISERVDHK